MDITLTPAMGLFVVVISGIMQAFKSYAVPGTTAAKLKPLFPIIGVAMGIGLCYVTKQTDPWLSGLAVGAAAVWGYEALKGIGPKKAVPLILISLLFVVGCTPKPVRMNPGMAMQVEMATITATEFDKRCDSGDPNACALGCKRATNTLKLIMDGYYGRPPTP